MGNIVSCAVYGIFRGPDAIKSFCSRFYSKKWGHGLRQKFHLFDSDVNQRMWEGGKLKTSLSNPRSGKMLLKCTARGEILIGELYLFRMR